MFDYFTHIQVWVIEYTVNDTTNYLAEIDKNGTAYWSKQLGRASTYQQTEHVNDVWKAINKRGIPVQHQLGKILAERSIVERMGN